VRGRQGEVHPEAQELPVNDIGWTGIAHDELAVGQTKVTVATSCTGSPPNCACSCTGPIPNPNAP
jgi:hypothetical protein